MFPSRAVGTAVRPGVYLRLRVVAKVDGVHSVVKQAQKRVQIAAFIGAYLHAGLLRYSYQGNAKCAASGVAHEEREHRPRP